MPNQYGSPLRGINGTAVFITVAGGLLVYSAVKNNKISVTLRDFLAGNTPPDSNAPVTSSQVLPEYSAPGGVHYESYTTGSGFSAIAAYMINNLGFSQAGAAGALGNIQVESNFNPGAYNPNEGAIGLCQWELGRRTALQAYAAAHGSTETDINMQLGYMRAELLSAFANVYMYERGTSDPASAAAYWDANYERSSGSTRSQRIANAESIYSQLGTSVVA